MLRVNKLADYGTVIMVTLAQQQHNQFTAKSLAELTHIPLPTVTKILKQLTHSGLIQSKQGSQGGYKLVGTPQDVSLAQILHAMGNKIDVIECSVPGLCSRESFCQPRSHWQAIAHGLQNALGQITLAQLASTQAQFDFHIAIQPTAEVCA
jgi:FeS assembly SUF system regulator